MSRIARLAKTVSTRWERAATAAGLIPTTTNYRRFIVLGTPRCGTNLLNGMLNSDPAVRVFGELFRTYNFVGWEMAGYPRKSRKMLAQFQTNPLGFLEQYVFSEHRASVQAVGFKMFYYMMDDFRLGPVRRELARNRDYLIIHLTRQNLLKQYVSLMKAYSVNTWRIRDGRSQGASSAIQIDPDECMRYFAKMTRQKSQYEELFKGHSKLNIEYEAMAEDNAGAAASVQEFLGVEARPLSVATVKQGVRPMSETVSNYDEVADVLVGTEWREFLD